MNSVSTLNTGQVNTTYREPLPARLARGLIRIISELVTLSVITFFLLMFLYASWSIYDAQRIFSGADTTVYETYKPESDVDDSPTFQELVAINPDVLGWITVYGTGIDYPLVQGETNDSYINTSVEKKFSLSGSIFLDSANEPDFSDFNTIIHGHHMEKHEMFGDLDLFREKAFFDSHEYGNIYYGGKNHGLQFFAIIDGGKHQISYYGHELALTPPACRAVPAHDNPDGTVWTVCGSLCTANDILIKQFDASALEIGDRLVFPNAGAYCMTEGISLFLSRDLPRVYLVDGAGTMALVRDRIETARLNTCREQNA